MFRNQNLSLRCQSRLWEVSRNHIRVDTNPSILSLSWWCRFSRLPWPSLLGHSTFRKFVAFWKYLVAQQAHFILAVSSRHLLGILSVIALAGCWSHVWRNLLLPRQNNSVGIGYFRLSNPNPNPNLGSVWSLRLKSLCIFFRSSAITWKCRRHASKGWPSLAAFGFAARHLHVFDQTTPVAFFEKHCRRLESSTIRICLDFDIVYVAISLCCMASYRIVSCEQSTRRSC